MKTNKLWRNTIPPRPQPPVTTMVDGVEYQVKDCGAANGHGAHTWSDYGRAAGVLWCRGHLFDRT